MANVTSIRKQFENKPPPPVPPFKPPSLLSTKNGPIASSSSSLSSVTNSDTKSSKASENEDIQIDKESNRIRRLSNGEIPQQFSFREKNISSTVAPFCYAKPDMVNKKIGNQTIVDDGKKKKGPLPPPPPTPPPLLPLKTNGLDLADRPLPPSPPVKPRFKNGIDVEETKEIVKPIVDGSKMKWQKIGDHWVPVADNFERSSVHSTSSTESEERQSTTVNGHYPIGSNNFSSPKSSVSDDIRDETNKDRQSTGTDSSSEPGSSFKKPDVPSRTHLRPPSRPLPPCPSTKPNYQRKNNEATNSTISACSSMPSLSDSEEEQHINTQETDGGNDDATNITPVAGTSTLTKDEKAARCAKEFLDTEKLYVKTLEDLSVHFPEFMKTQNNSVNRPSVEPDNIPTLIANSLHEIRDFHRVLAENFQSRLDNWENDPRLADILLRTGHFLKMSIRFLQRKEELAMTIINACKRYPDFQASLAAFERQQLRGLHLVHTLDSVHQHLCRYPLLLSSYLKYLSPDSAEYEAAEKAKDFINKITLDLEGSLAQEDGTRKLNELYRRITVPSRFEFIEHGKQFEVIEPGRKLLKEGPILKYSRKELQPRHLILFNDVLICCAPVVASMLRVRHIIYLNHLATSVSVGCDSKTDQNESGWEFVVKGRQKSIIFVADATEGRSWVKAIQNAISSAQQKPSDTMSKRPISVVSIPSTNDDTTSSLGTVEPEPPLSPAIFSPLPFKLGQSAPAWTPDKRVTMCQCCSSAFTVLRRRHHCRACGKVICDDCSGRAPLEYLDYNPDRVCRECYGILYERTKDETYVEVIMDRNRYTRSQLLCFFAAPKNGFRLDQNSGVDTHLGIDTYEEEGDAILISGDLRLSRNRQQWKRYFVVVRDIGLMEFYKAVNDRTSETKLPLLGWQATVVPGEEFVIELSHTNQLPAVSNGDSNSLHYWLKADDAVSMERWLEALDKFFAKFTS